MLKVNRRSVWTINTARTDGEHPAVFPEELAARCILASTRPGDTVLDPFAGSGTTGVAAIKEGRRAILCECSPAYLDLILKRTNITPGLGIL